MIARRNTLVKSFTLMILLILVVGQGILYTWLLLYQKSHLEEKLHDDMKAVTRFIAETAAQRGADQQSLETFTASFLKTGLVLSVRITDGGGRTVFSRAENDTGAGEGIFPLFGVFSVPATNTVRVPVVMPDAEGAGTVEVSYSGKPVNDVMKRFLVIPPVMQSITFIVVIYAIILFFRRKVSSPVARINTALGGLTEGNLAAEVPDMGDDEIGSIARGTRFLAENLSVTITRFNELSHDVVAALGRLTNALGSMRGSTQKQAEEIGAVISSIRAANDQQKRSAEGTDELSRVSHDNVSSLLEMKSAAEEIAASTERLFRSTEASYAQIARMSQISRVIADGSGEVLRAIEDTTASAEEINASLGSVRENARKSTELSSHVRRLLTERGTLAVAEAIDAMEQITRDVENFEKIVSRLNDRSKDIEKVLAVMQDVTDKTNLLSLNASILAEQAGQHGKGFSVVAGEIRALSDGTTASTKDIAEIVRQIQKEIREAAEAIRGGVRKVEEGKELIIKSGMAMGETLEAAQKSVQMTTVVEKATEEQSGGVLQIRKSMENVKLLFEQVARGMDEEREGAGRMLDSISEVKEVAEVVRKGTGEHAAGTRLISKNLEMSLAMVSQIHQAAVEQLNVNEDIVGAVENIRKTGIAAMQDMEGIARSFEALMREVETLKREIGFFRTRNHPDSSRKDSSPKGGPKG